MTRPVVDSLLRKQAAAWAVRLDAGDCSAEDIQRLDAWLAADPSRRPALDAARALWLELNVPALESMRRGDDTPKRPPLRWLGIAATVLMTIAALGWVTRDDWLIALRADQQTAVGESRWMMLDDGSRIQLNTQTAVAVDYSRDTRAITLLRGEAAFEVAHDPSRPFRVTAANGTVTALGTVFQVRIDEGLVTSVIVTQGRVRVRTKAAAADIDAGEQIVYSGERLGARAAVDVESASAWRRGQLSFIEQPLGDVVAQLDRYYAGRIQVTNPALAARPVSGVFATARPLDAIAVIERNLGVKARRAGETIVID